MNELRAQKKEEEESFVEEEEECEDIGADEEDEDCAPRRFLAKDGEYYDTYIEMAQANKRRNDQILGDLGLLGMVGYRASSKNRASDTSNETSIPTRLSRTRAQTHSLTRRSDRVRGRDPGGAVPRKKRKGTATHKPKMQARRRTSSTKGAAPGIVLTRSQRQRLQSAFPNWIPLLQKFLLSVQGVSRANCTHVMRQIQKLASGEGVGYQQWQTRVVFYERQRISLATDLQQVMQEAVDFEDRHGRDLGNGWLLRHPIRKLELFQQHCYGQLKQKQTLIKQR